MSQPFCAHCTSDGIPLRRSLFDGRFFWMCDDCAVPKIEPASERCRKYSQVSILRAIISYTRKNSEAPKVSELAKYVGLQRSSLKHHLYILRDTGKIRLPPNQPIEVM